MHYNIPCRILQLVLFIHIICAVGIWCLSLPTSTINSDTPTAMIYTTKAEMTMISHYHNYFSSPSTLTHPLRYLKYRTVTINENGFHAKTRFAISISLKCCSVIFWPYFSPCNTFRLQYFFTVQYFSRAMFFAHNTFCVQYFLLAILFFVTFPALLFSFYISTWKHRVLLN